MTTTLPDKGQQISEGSTPPEVSPESPAPPAPKKTRSTRRRVSGETAAMEVAAEQAKQIEEPEKPEIPEDREQTFVTPGFQRMRFDWRGDDRAVIQQAKAAVEGRVVDRFLDAYRIMEEIFEIVREKAVDSNGVVQTDQWGFPLWRRSHTGAYIEDYTRLTHAQREHFLFKVTSNLFNWEQDAADIWAEAMFAKAQWTEAFSMHYDAPSTGTIEDRTAVGNTKSAEERYFAIFLSAYSRKADAIVKSMERLSQRLKDTLPS